MLSRLRRAALNRSRGMITIVASVSVIEVLMSHIAVPNRETGFDRIRS